MNPRFGQMLGPGSVRRRPPHLDLPRHTTQVTLYPSFMFRYTINQRLADGSNRWIHVLYRPSEDLEGCEVVVWRQIPRGDPEGSIWRPMDVLRAHRH